MQRSMQERRTPNSNAPARAQRRIMPVRTESGRGRHSPLNRMRGMRDRAAGTYRRYDNRGFRQVRVTRAGVSCGLAYRPFRSPLQAMETLDLSVWRCLHRHSFARACDLVTGVTRFLIGPICAGEIRIHRRQGRRWHGCCPCRGARRGHAVECDGLRQMDHMPVQRNGPLLSLAV